MHCRCDPLLGKQNIPEMLYVLHFQCLLRKNADIMDCSSGKLIQGTVYTEWGLTLPTLLLRWIWLVFLQCKRQTQEEKAKQQSRCSVHPQDACSACLEIRAENSPHLLSQTLVWEKENFFYLLNKYAVSHKKPPKH